MGKCNRRFFTSSEIEKYDSGNIRIKAKGLIQRIGPDKGGHWKVLKK